MFGTSLTSLTLYVLSKRIFCHSCIDMIKFLRKCVYKQVHFAVKWLDQNLYLWQYYSDLLTFTILIRIYLLIREFTSNFKPNTILTLVFLH